MSAAIRLEQVSKIFDGAVTAVDRIDLVVEPGEFFSLLGPSGCGKTTTLRMIAGFEDPTAGRILVGGRDVTEVPVHSRDMAMIFQNYALFPHRTVFQNVAFGLRMRNVAPDEIARRARRALDMVSLAGLEDRRPAQLSGGQQQRVALARALVIEPSVLLCDEPLGALDKKLRQQMQFELKGLQRELGVTLVFVTHDQEEALAMSDRIAVMKDGRVEQIGAPLEIYDRPSSRFVADFIGDTNIIEGRVEAGSDGRAQITAPGIVQPLADGGAIAGTHAAVALRPEKIRLAGNGIPFDVTVSGIVELANFHGESVLLRVAVDGGPRLLARAPNDGTGRPPRPGERLMLGWNRDDAVPLRS